VDESWRSDCRPLARLCLRFLWLPTPQVLQRLLGHRVRVARHSPGEGLGTSKIRPFTGPPGVSENIEYSVRAPPVFGHPRSLSGAHALKAAA